MENFYQYRYFLKVTSGCITPKLCVILAIFVVLANSVQAQASGNKSMGFEYMESYQVSIKKGRLSSTIFKTKK